MRRAIGDAVLSGRGYEFGAGLTPSLFQGVTELTVIDKRNCEELEALFGAPPPYKVLSYEDAQLRPPMDFVTAHHVLEHCPDPIGVVREWVRLVRNGGVIFFSIPSSNNVCETQREVTPLRHLLMDHLMQADGRDFDSRNHVPSFVCQWTAIMPEAVWYAQDGAKRFAEVLLDLQGAVEGHDLHWHTYSAETFRTCIEVAAWLAMRSLSELSVTETGDELFVTARLGASPSAVPAAFAAFLEDMHSRLDRMSEGLSQGEQAA